MEKVSFFGVNNDILDVGKSGRKLVDFREQRWGHSMGGSALFISSVPVANGDYFLLKTEGEDMIYQFLDVERMRDPKDMYRIEFYCCKGTPENEDEYKVDFLDSFDNSRYDVYDANNKATGILVKDFKLEERG